MTETELEQMQSATRALLAHGGPAFPVQLEANNGHGGMVRQNFTGMAMRDYFAAHALTTVKHWPGGARSGATALYDAIADDCYAMADAMLKAREKKL